MSTFVTFSCRLFTSFGVTLLYYGCTKCCSLLGEQLRYGGAYKAALTPFMQDLSVLLPLPWLADVTSGLVFWILYRASVASRSRVVWAFLSSICALIGITMLFLWVLLRQQVVMLADMEPVSVRAVSCNISFVCLLAILVWRSEVLIRDVRRTFSKSGDQ